VIVNAENRCLCASHKIPRSNPGQGGAVQRRRSYTELRMLD
jgi:hypothetical protein